MLVPHVGPAKKIVIFQTSFFLPWIDLKLLMNALGMKKLNWVDIEIHFQAFCIVVKIGQVASRITLQN